MRLWSLHPRYLDGIGLVALWREGLLAQAVLGGRTRGYTRHPQLTRFREHVEPDMAIAKYLHHVADEAESRGYSFNRTKLPVVAAREPLSVTGGQLLFEWKHLKAKLRERNPQCYRRIVRIATPDPHPSFAVIAGQIAEWERRARTSP